MSDEKKKISLPIVGAESDQASTPKSREEGGDINSEIQKEITENKIVLYMKGTPQQPMCGFSAKAAAVVASYGVPFHTVNILEDPEKRQGIKDFGDWPTIPQLYVGGELLGGSDIVSKMHESGQLEDVISEAFGEA
ncbi:MAG: Grx4 family monothiol glutaredoxin [Myxococcota bacterium]